MITLVEGASRQKTPNEIALTILLSALTLIFLIAMMSLKAFGIASSVDFTDPGPGGLVGLFDTHHDRWIAERDRYRRH